jgi:transcriptional regulator with XRE-family HTH domain
MTDPVELRKIISSRLAIARQNSGLSQAQVAKQINLPRPSITEIEAGRRRVSVEELVHFSDLYQVDLNWLSGQDVDQADPVRDKLQLAARHVANLKSEDLEKVIDLLISLRVKDTK